MDALEHARSISQNESKRDVNAITSWIMQDFSINLCAGNQSHYLKIIIGAQMCRVGFVTLKTIVAKIFHPCLMTTASTSLSNAAHTALLYLRLCTRIKRRAVCSCGKRRQRWLCGHLRCPRVRYTRGGSVHARVHACINFANVSLTWALISN